MDNERSYSHVGQQNIPSWSMCQLSDYDPWLVSISDLHGPFSSRPRTKHDNQNTFWIKPETDWKVWQRRSHRLESPAWMVILSFFHWSRWIAESSFVIFASCMVEWEGALWGCLVRLQLLCQNHTFTVVRSLRGMCNAISEISKRLQRLKIKEDGRIHQERSKCNPNSRFHVCVCQNNPWKRRLFIHRTLT